MSGRRSTRVVVLGAGFGGLELSTLLSEAGGGFDVTLIDKNEAFVFGFSKLDAEKEHFGSSRRARWFAG